MIKVDSLLYKIDQRLNKLSSNYHQQIQLEDKILALNEAQLKLIKSKVEGSTASKMGLDAFKKRYDDLSKLIIPFKKLNLSLTDNKLNKWSADISELDPKYMFYIESYVLADKGRCKNHKIWINKDLTKHGDISVLLNNVHYAPSFEYQETFNTMSSETISTFTDGTFTPTVMYLSYLRYPQYINKEGYIDFDGNPSQNVDCELADYLEDELLDLTVQNLSMYIENNTAIQTSQMRINTNL